MPNPGLRVRSTTNAMAVASLRSAANRSPSAPVSRSMSAAQAQARGELLHGQQQQLRGSCVRVGVGHVRHAPPRLGQRRLLAGVHARAHQLPQKARRAAADDRGRLLARGREVAHVVVGKVKLADANAERPQGLFGDLLA